MRMPFADGTFDCVTCGWVIEHLPDPRPRIARDRPCVAARRERALILATEDTVSGAHSSAGTWRCRTYNRSELEQRATATKRAFPGRLSSGSRRSIASSRWVASSSKRSSQTPTDDPNRSPKNALSGPYEDRTCVKGLQRWIGFRRYQVGKPEAVAEGGNAGEDAHQ